MDPCLRLALLEWSYTSDLVDEVRSLPAEERQLRYPELIAEEIPADADEACWTDEAELLAALPDDADYTIRTLAGIEAHPGLRRVHLTESEIDDLTPLPALPALELLWLGVTPAADLTPLLSCDRLQRVHIECIGLLSAPAREVLATLAAHGVQVDNLLPNPVTAAAPFADPILKLAVLDTLRRSIDLPTTYFFDEYRFDDDNLARLMTIEIPQKQLDSVETLVLDRWRTHHPTPGLGTVGR